MLAADGNTSGVFTPSFFARVFQVEAKLLPDAGFCFVDNLG
jgi:hypothetical protein